MKEIDETITDLRRKGFRVGESYVQEGLGPLGARMLVVVNDVAMSFDQARALETGGATLEEIAADDEGRRR